MRSPPDLEVGKPSVSDAGPAPGGTFTLSATVRNTGAGGAAATTLRWYRSTERNHHDLRHVGGHGRGWGACRLGDQRRVGLPDRAGDGGHVLLRCLRGHGNGRVRYDRQLLIVRSGWTYRNPAPDLEVGTPTVSDAGPAPGGSFTLSATVRNAGAEGSAATTLRWYRSTDATITTSDTPVGTDAIEALSASGASAESIVLTAPSTSGTYYYGACVDAASDESDTTDNCSSSVKVGVGAPPPNLEVERAFGVRRGSVEGRVVHAVGDGAQLGHRGVGGDDAALVPLDRTRRSRPPTLR